MRRVLPGIVALLSGLMILLDMFFENPLLDVIGAHLLEGAIIIGGLAFILGLWNLLVVHERRIGRRERNWGTSVVIILSAFGSLVLGLVAWQTPLLTWFYRYLLFPLEAAAGALVSFALVGAAMRVWRLGALQGSLLLIIGLVVLLGSLPSAVGPLARLGPVRDWIVTVPTLAAVRGILLGVSLGVMATGLRVLLWVDRPYE